MTAMIFLDTTWTAKVIELHYMVQTMLSLAFYVGYITP